MTSHAASHNSTHATPRMLTWDPGGAVLLQVWGGDGRHTPAGHVQGAACVRQGLLPGGSAGAAGLAAAHRWAFALLLAHSCLCMHLCLCVCTSTYISDRQPGTACLCDPLTILSACEHACVCVHALHCDRCGTHTFFCGTLMPREEALGMHARPSLCAHKSRQEDVCISKCERPACMQVPVLQRGRGSAWQQQTRSCAGLLRRSMKT